MSNTDVDIWRERYDLAMERLEEIVSEQILPEKFNKYFVRTAEMIVLRAKSEVKEEMYENSYADPVYAVKELGEVYGRLLSFLYYELSLLKNIAKKEQMLWELVIRMELFLEIYAAFSYDWQENGRLLAYESARMIVYWFAFDYADLAAENYLKPGALVVQGSILYDQQLTALQQAIEDGCQEAYDHRFDVAILLDKNYVSRKLDVLKTALEKYGASIVPLPGKEDWYLNKAGLLFKEEAVMLDVKQQYLWQEYRLQLNKLLNKGEYKAT